VAKVADNVMKENAARVKRGEKPLTKKEWDKLTGQKTTSRGGDNKNGTKRQ
jgi:hypothetical protein